MLNRRRNDPMGPRSKSRWVDLLERYRTAWVFLFLAAAVWICFGQVLHFDFVNYDDPQYVIQNPQVRQGLSLKGVVWAFTSFHAANWHPLTWLSHMADASLFALSPGGHHWTSVVLHLVNCLLLYGFLSAATGVFWPSAAVAAIFALHPLHVESVAWVAERKDVLSACFGFLSLIFYVRFARREKRRDYLFCFIFLAMGLMAKPMLVTWPLVFLLLDWWPLNRLSSVGSGQTAFRRFRDLVVEKIPFLLLSVASSAVTLAAQQSGQAIRSIEVFPVSLRLANAAVSYVGYMAKTLWPARLSFFYVHPGRDIPPWHLAGAVLLLAAAAAACYRLRGRFPYLMAGYGWFVLTLLPVIGIVQVGGQAMADRYMYLPMVGLLVMACWSAEEMIGSGKKRRIAAAVTALVVLAALGFQTHRQTAVWKDSIALYRHALAMDDNNWLAYNNLGGALETEGRLEEAAEMYRRQVAILPHKPGARRNLAVVMLKLGRPAEALSHYQAALAVSPDDLKARSGLAACLDRLGRPEEAIAEYRKMLAASPGRAKTWINIALIQSRIGKDAEAVASFRRVLDIEPENALALYHLSWLLSTHPLEQIRSGQEALVFADRLVRVNGDHDPLTMDVLGAALAEAGRFAEAEKTAVKALALAERSGLSELAAAIALRREDYRRHRPFRGRVLPDRSEPVLDSPDAERIRAEESRSKGQALAGEGEEGR